jgi:hypothetical protein
MDQEKGRQRLGMLYVAASAILFASKGLFAKALYQRGVGFELLVAVRAVLAVPLFAWVADRIQPGTADADPLVSAVIAGITCYYVGAWSVWARPHRRVNRAAYCCSVSGLMVLIGSFQTTRPGGRLVMTLVVTYIGIFFAMGGIGLRNSAEHVRGLLRSSPRSPPLSTFSLVNVIRRAGSLLRFAAIGMSAALMLLCTSWFRSFEEFRRRRPTTLLARCPGIACSSRAAGRGHAARGRSAAIATRLARPPSLAALFLMNT